MKERLRRTMLYVPGNNPGMVKDAGIYGADSMMFDLEDSVSLEEKDAARFLVYEALTSLDLPDGEYLVRVNSLDSAYGREDLEAVVRTGRVAIRLPKTECAQDVLACEAEIARIERDCGIAVGTTPMMAAVESAAGVLNAREIAAATPRLMGIALGAEDYVADLKTSRSPDGIELQFARSMVLLAARAAGIDAIDTIYSDIHNEEGFRQEVRLIKQLGFDGKSIINPRQVNVVHEIYTPTEQEVLQARAVMEAMEEARRRGSGVASLHGKMVDRPVALRARRTLMLAGATGYGGGEDEVQWN